MEYLSNRFGQDSMKRYVAGLLTCALIAGHALLVGQPEFIELLRGDQFLIGGLLGLSMAEYFSK